MIDKPPTIIGHYRFPVDGSWDRDGDPELRGAVLSAGPGPRPLRAEALKRGLEGQVVPGPDPPTRQKQSLLVFV